MSTDNTTESLANSSVTEAPGLWVTLYDPTYKLGDAIAEGQLQVAQIDANSGANVNVGLRYYEYLHRAPIHRYGASTDLTSLHGYIFQVPLTFVDIAIYNRPNLDLVCDVVKDGWYPCHIHLDVEIPILLQTVVREIKSLTWSVCCNHPASPHVHPAHFV